MKDGNRVDSKFHKSAVMVTRLALSLAFLSAVADRFGVLGKFGTRNVAWGDWAHFVAYTGQLLAVFPHYLISWFAWAATVAELAFGILLLIGLQVRIVGMLSGCLLGAFGVAMAIALGIKAPLNFSVFSAMGACWLLAFAAPDWLTIDALLGKSV